MVSANPDAQRLAEAGVAALNAGQWHEAKALFDRLVAADASSIPGWLGLAYACQAGGDCAATLAAVDRALALEPANLRALMLKADSLEAAGDARAAAAFYLHALRKAPPPEQRPPALQRELARAQAMLDRRAGAIESEVRERLGPAASSRRVAESMDILFGKASPCFQQPRYYFFPGLPQIAFFDDRAPFPWLAALEAATGDIRAEALAVMRQDGAFAPYVRRRVDRPQKVQGSLLDNPDWSAFYLWKDGQPVAENAARCPKTMAAIEHIPLSHLRGRTPSVLFSLLRPGAHIPPHHGMINTRLIGHLPLIVPPGCEFRVGNERREWVEGRAWLFDDSIEHEAWNRSGQTRVILLFEVWRPELSENERAEVAALFEAIDACGGGGGAWADA